MNFSHYFPSFSHHFPIISPMFLGGIPLLLGKSRLDAKVSLEFTTSESFVSTWKEKRPRVHVVAQKNGNTKDDLTIYIDLYWFICFVTVYILGIIMG